MDAYIESRSGGNDGSDRPAERPPRKPPIYYVWPASPDHTVMAKRKPQVAGLRFSRNQGHGRQIGVKRSRWAGFVAAAPSTVGPGCPEAGRRWRDGIRAP